MQVQTKAQKEFINGSTAKFYVYCKQQIEQGELSSAVINFIVDDFDYSITIEQLYKSRNSIELIKIFSGKFYITYKSNQQEIALVVGSYVESHEFTHKDLADYVKVASLQVI